MRIQRRFNTFKGTPKKQMPIRGSSNGHKNRLTQSEECLKKAYERINKKNKYRIVATVDHQFVALRLAEKWTCSLTVKKERYSKTWAYLEVHWNGHKVPTLDQLEEIKNDFLGEQAYFIIIFQEAIKPHSAIMKHCVGDELLPKDGPTWSI